MPQSSPPASHRSARDELAPGERTLRIVSRLLPRSRRAASQAALAAGRLREIERLDLLAPERLERLVAPSLWLLLGSGAAFVGLDIVARVARPTGPLLGTGSPWARGAALVLVNVASYAAILPLHEGVHALVMLALGGRPRFGLKLPIAAYCTAPDQVFTRNGFVAIALAPLVALSAAGAVVTWLAPDAGACIAFALAGNVSGAVADLATVARLRRLPADALILDTDIGYTAFQAAHQRQR